MNKIISAAFLIILLITGTEAQELLDGFNRADSSLVGNNWIEAETSASAAEINTNRLQLNANGISGREWVYQDISAQYETVFDDNTDSLTWAWNMRYSKLNPGGFDAGKYGLLFVLGATTSDISTADGYGVTISKDGGNFPVNIVRFTGGFNDNSDFTVIASGGDFGTDYCNINVDYNPLNGRWSLYAEGNPSTFVDPLTTTTLLDTVTDTTFTGNNLAYLGCYYNHSNGATENAFFDNIYIPGLADPPTTVEFASATFSTNEAVGTYSIEVVISNEDLNNATTAEVVLTGGTATNGTDILTYSTQTVTFPAGSSSSQYVNITIVDDDLVEATETLIFELQNISGGNNARAGLNQSTTVNIIDNDIAELIISEVTDPLDNANLRYVEIYNMDNTTIDFSTQTWYLSRQNNGRSTQWFDIQLVGTVAAGAVFVVAYSQPDFLTAFGSDPDQESSDITGDGRDGYFLYYNGDHSSGTLVDAYGVIDQDGSLQIWDYTDGHAYRNEGVKGPNPSFNITEWTINKPVNSTEMDPSDSSLPVELNSFQVIAGVNEVKLTWSTASEINNIGFIVERSDTKNGPYTILDSYKTLNSLMGAGNSSVQNDYKYVDNSVVNKKKYWYRIGDKDYKGVVTYHGPVSAIPGDHNKNFIKKGFTLQQNFPNPFNPSTEIVVEILSDDQSIVELTIYNILGKKIRSLFDGSLEKGKHSFTWNGTDYNGKKVASGYYIYIISRGEYKDIRKMLLIK